MKNYADEQMYEQVEEITDEELQMMFKYMFCNLEAGLEKLKDLQKTE